MTDTIIAYKGFDKDMKCRNHQFEVGKTYTVKGEIEACHNGFHACEGPFDVWSYYSPGSSRFAITEQSGDIARHTGDSKVASAKIYIQAELTLPEFVQRGVDWLLSNVTDSKTESNTGYQSAATNTGYQSAATNTGYRSAATNTGYQSAATVEGENSIAAAFGINGRAKAAKGCGIVLCEYDDDYNLKKVLSGIAGRGKIKPDVWYTAENGKIVEWAE